MGGLAFVALELNTRERLERVERADPCVTLAQAVEDGAGGPHLGDLTRDCRDFLNGLGPVIPLGLACAIIREARYTCPAPGSSPRLPRSSPSTPPLGPTLPGVSSIPGTADVPVVPDDGGGADGGRGGRGHSDNGATRNPPAKGSPGGGESPPSGAPAESPVTPSSPGNAPASPGDSGQGSEQGKGTGLELCVELVVSACADADVRPKGQTLLP